MNFFQRPYPNLVSLGGPHFTPYLFIIFSPRGCEFLTCCKGYTSFGGVLRSLDHVVTLRHSWSLLLWALFSLQKKPGGPCWRPLLPHLQHNDAPVVFCRRTLGPTAHLCTNITAGSQSWEHPSSLYLLPSLTPQGHSPRASLMMPGVSWIFLVF